MEKTNLYVAPEVEVIEVAVEKGFAQSDPYGDNYEDVGVGGSGSGTAWPD